MGNSQQIVLTFEVYDGEAFVTRRELSAESVTIGRGAAAMLQVDHESLADLHAVINVNDDGSVVLLDLIMTRNRDGTFLRLDLIMTRNRVATVLRHGLIMTRNRVATVQRHGLVLTRNRVAKDRGRGRVGGRRARKYHGCKRRRNSRA